jgi:catechol 2,3-dioxygenase-like lactoylglutathione lyase family enzyme
MKPILTHIAIIVSNVDQTIRFYSEWCGMSVVHTRVSEDHPDRQVVWLSSPGYEGKFVIVVLPGGIVKKTPDQSGFDHLGIAVESAQEVQNLAARAKAAGILFWDYQVEPYPVGPNCAVSDPDGNIVEFSYGQPIGFNN